MNRYRELWEWVDRADGGESYCFLLSAVVNLYPIVDTCGVQGRQGEYDGGLVYA